jgi:hypothetical protein
VSSSIRIRSRFTVFAAVLAIAIMLVGALTTPAYAKSQPAKMRKIIRHVAQNYGLKEADIKALYKLCKRESDFNPRERTGSYKGLFQLDSHHKQVWDPAWNTGVAIKYIKKRFKTPRRALAHSYRYGWY